MNDISRSLINEAAGKLQDIGATQEANEVIQLLAKYEGTRVKHWLDEDLIEELVRMKYPPSPEWSDEIKARHFRHIKLALQLDHEALNEDIRDILKRAEGLNNA